MKDYTVKIFNVALEVIEYTVGADSRNGALHKALIMYFDSYNTDIKKVEVLEGGFQNEKTDNNL